MALRSITWLARQAGVKPSTVRFYERQGLLPESRADNGYRTYDDDDVLRLRFIRRAGALGFTLGEIAAALAASDRGVVSDERLRVLAKQKVTAIEAQVQALQRIQGALSTLLRRRKPGPCPLLHAFDDDDADTAAGPSSAVIVDAVAKVRGARRARA
jgi:MerR family copper efflux transcriptional regulator